MKNLILCDYCKKPIRMIKDIGYFYCTSIQCKDCYYKHLKLKEAKEDE